MAGTEGAVARDKTVLVVDSDQGIRDLIRTAIEGALAVRVVTADGDEEAIRLLSELRPDLLLVEVWARPRRGVAVVRRVKSNPATREVPVIALTYSDDGRAVALGAGCDDYLSMPFQIDDLLHKVERNLGMGRPVVAPAA